MGAQILSTSDKILLLYRGPQKECKEFFSSFVPAGLFNILKALLAKGFNAELHNLSDMKSGDINAFFNSRDFSAALISGFFGNHLESFTLAKSAKKARPDAITVLGGPVSVMGAEILMRIPAVDFVIRGEGEEAVPGLLRCWQKGATPDKVPGLIYRNGGTVMANATVPLCDIDRYFYLPSEISGYCHNVSTENFSVLITSRGCPFSCSFCSSPALWSRRSRSHSTDNLVRYLADLRKTTGAIYFSIRDDNFLSDRARVTGFCKALGKINLHYLWNVQGSGRFVDEEMAAVLADAGCDQVQIGIESASERILKLLNKKNDRSRLTSAIGALRKQTIRPFGYFIAGMDESREEVRETTDFIRNSGVMDGVLSPLVIYPGTALAEGIPAGRFFEHREIIYYSKRSYDRHCDEYLTAIDFARNGFFTHAELYADRKYRFLKNITRHFFFLRLDKPEQARHQLDEISRNEPFNPWPHYLAGEMLAEQGRMKAARTAYAKADRILGGINMEIRGKAET